MNTGAEGRSDRLPERANIIAVIRFTRVFHFTKERPHDAGGKLQTGR
jgi:hypothetical protein